MATLAPAAPPTTAIEANSSRNNEGVCVLKKYSSCSASDKERVLRCERAGCAKFVHRSCSLRVTEPFRPADEPIRVVCGKRCYNALHKNHLDAIKPGLPESGAAAKASSNGGENARATRASPNERKKRSPWNCDGPTPEINSLAVLLEWLRVPKNYECWVKGGDETRFQTKASIAAHILGLIKASGVDTDRNPNDVFAKIYQLEKSFAEVSGWLRANEKTTDPARLVAGAKKRCTYYYDLVDSMGAQYSKGNNNGASINTRKRGAAADSDESNTRDASKRQMVGVTGSQLRRRNTEWQNKEASSVQAKIAAKNKGPVTPEKATTPISITPVLMNHSFLKASSNSLAPKKPTTESVHAAHLAALNASFLLANSLVAPNTATPPNSTTVATGSTSTTSSSTAIVPVSSTPADASMAAFNGSLRQQTSSGSTLRPKPAILGTTAAGLADMIASNTKPGNSSKTSATTSPASANSSTSSSTNTSIVSVPAVSGTAPPIGFSTSMLQVNNSMLQATAEKLQAEAKIATITANTALLRARKTLREEGVPQAEIDAVLPLARH